MKNGKIGDNQIIFRETTMMISGKYGLVSSFLPKIFVDKAKNGILFTFKPFKRR